MFDFTSRLYGWLGAEEMHGSQAVRGKLQWT